MDHTVWFIFMTSGLRYYFRPDRDRLLKNAEMVGSSSAANADDEDTENEKIRKQAWFNSFNVRNMTRVVHAQINLLAEIRADNFRINLELSTLYHGQSRKKNERKGYFWTFSNFFSNGVISITDYDYDP